MALLQVGTLRPREAPWVARGHTEVGLGRAALCDPTQRALAQRGSACLGEGPRGPVLQPAGNFLELLLSIFLLFLK